MSTLDSAPSARIKSVFFGRCQDLPSDGAKISDALAFIESYDESNARAAFIRFEIGVRYNNGDEIRGQFNDKAAALDGFERVADILANSHFLDGCGDSFEHICRLAKSQGAKAVVFVDGDKGHNKRLTKLQKDHSDVPVIRLPAGTEFEEIVPLEDYFVGLQEYLQQYLGERAAQVNLEAFHEWESRTSPPERMMLTKRLEWWLNDHFETGLEKPAAMRTVLECCRTSKVNSEPFRRLVASMTQLFLEVA